MTPTDTLETLFYWGAGWTLGAYLLLVVFERYERRRQGRL